MQYPYSQYELSIPASPTSFCLFKTGSIVQLNSLLVAAGGVVGACLWKNQGRMQIIMGVTPQPRNLLSIFYCRSAASNFYQVSADFISEKLSVIFICLDQVVHTIHTDTAHPFIHQVLPYRPNKQPCIHAIPRLLGPHHQLLRMVQTTRFKLMSLL